MFSSLSSVVFISFVPKQFAFLRLLGLAGVASHCSADGEKYLLGFLVVVGIGQNEIAEEYLLPVGCSSNTDVMKSRYTLNC